MGNSGGQADGKGNEEDVQGKCQVVFGGKEQQRSHYATDAGDNLVVAIIFNLLPLHIYI